MPLSTCRAICKSVSRFNGTRALVIMTISLDVRFGIVAHVGYANQRLVMRIAERNFSYKWDAFSTSPIIDQRIFNAKDLLSLGSLFFFSVAIAHFVSLYVYISYRHLISKK
jgi:hypothetical protein